jgi:hypothetical protein
MGQTKEKWASDKRQKKKIFPSAQRSDQLLGPGVFYMGVMWLGRQAGRSPPTNKETRNRWINVSIYTHIFAVR